MMNRLMKKRCWNVNSLLKVSMNKLPSNNKFGNFDMIWADGTLHHSESIETAIKNVAKVLKKSGYFICSFIPNTFLFRCTNY